MTATACNPKNQFRDTLGKVAGFSLHAGVATKIRSRCATGPLVVEYPGMIVVVCR